MKNINNLIKRYENITEYTNTVSEEWHGVASFYMLPDGRFLNCMADYNFRSDDHRLIFGATRINDQDQNKWEKLHRNYKLVRLVPECNTAIIGKRQKLTDQQQQQIDLLGFEIERYI